MPIVVPNNFLAQLNNTNTTIHFFKMCFLRIKHTFKNSLNKTAADNNTKNRANLTSTSSDLGEQECLNLVKEGRQGWGHHCLQGKGVALSAITKNLVDITVPEVSTVWLKLFNI